MKELQISVLPLVADILRGRPGVRDLVAYRLSRGEREKTVVFVVPDEDYVDAVLGRAAAEKSQIRIWRKTYELTQLTKTAAAPPLAFNTLGWNSVYTRRPIPEEDMREWVQTTVERISTLAPGNVLEIGCGTGLLLLRIAPTSNRYVGLDFSPAVLRRLNEQLSQMPGLADKVELLERAANDLEEFAENSFDTIIINSVAQYFPSPSYLNRVMEKAIHAIKPGGHLFIGDLRSLSLLETFALSVEANDAAPEMTAAELRERVRSRIRQEQELVLSPTFFLSAKLRFPKVCAVDIYPRRGMRDNEMNRFRYDAILRVGPQSSQSIEVPFLKPPDGGWTIQEMRSRLAAAGSRGLGFTCIENARTARDARLLARLALADANQPFAELRDGLDRPDPRGIHPEALAQLGADLGFEVALSWAACHVEGRYDAAFLPSCSAVNNIFPLINWPQPGSADYVYFASAPGQAEFREKLAAEMASCCNAELSAESVPENLYIVDSLPTDDEDCTSLFAKAFDPAGDLSSHRSLI
jgi:SAM-dependent methyltransferase